MSDRYAGRIQIGGVLPVRKLPELASVICATDLDIEMNWASGDDRSVTVGKLRDWLRRRDSPKTLNLSAGELVDGRFDILERWLSANDMSYLRHSDAYADIEAEIVGYVGGVSVRSDANNAGDALVRACDMLRVRGALLEGRIFDAMDLLNRFLPNVYDIPPFMVEYADGRLL